MEIKNKFDKDEGKLLFWVDGIEGGPIIYADTVEEGEAKVMQLLVDGEVLRRILRIGKKITEYCEKYKNTPIYNEIMLAVQFGYQLSLKEEDETNNL